MRKHEWTLHVVLIVLLLGVLGGCGSSSQQTVSATKAVVEAAVTAPQGTAAATPSLVTATTFNTITPTVPPATATATPSSTTTPPSPTPPPKTATPTATIEQPTATATAIITDTTGLISGQALLDALKAGGFVVFFRHAATDMTQKDTNLAACETQRNLNYFGRLDARAIGEAIKQLAIPLDKIFSSPYCRTLETAQLAFGRFEPVHFLGSLPTTNQSPYLETLLNLLATPPPPGTNTVIVSHTHNMEAILDIQLAEGEAAIFNPLGNKDFRLVARLIPSDWQRLIALTR